MVTAARVPSSRTTNTFAISLISSAYCFNASTVTVTLVTALITLSISNAGIALKMLPVAVSPYNLAVSSNIALIVSLSVKIATKS